LNLPPAIHGARDYAELQQLGLQPDDVIDFSTNSNPFGPHPSVLQAVQNAVSRPTVARYPDRDCLALRAAIATADHVPSENILPGNGATELIHLIALTFIKPETCHLVLSPTFGEYTRAIRLMGGNIYEHHPQTHTNLRLNVVDVASIVQRLKPESVWFCNPNNPTGQYWTSNEFASLYNTVDPEQKILWVIDEAYRNFVHSNKMQGHTKWPDHPNIIYLRSLTKDYSLAGLRLGYLVADANILTPLQTAKLPWSVSSIAQIAGIATLQPDAIAWSKESLSQLHQHAANLWRGLTSLGFDVSPTETTFALIRVDNATRFRHRLLQAGLLVRDCASFGLPDHIRIAAHTQKANARLVETIGNLEAL
jgi:histidinol-phosphate aminotransferase